jgi:hypothetical protein
MANMPFGLLRTLLAASRLMIRTFRVVTCLAIVAAAIATCSHALATTGGALATSGFNDQLGINSDPTPNSPFQIGVTVNNQGAGEPGWDTPWVRLGGFDDRAPVSSEFVHEGDAAVKLFADNVFGTAFERPWANIVPQVRIDAFVLVRPSAAMRGHATFTTNGGEIINRTAAFWEIESSGFIRVFNKATGQFEQTGFSTLPNAWNKYSLILNAATQSWHFAFNDQPFRANNPLPFVNPTLFVDRVNMQAAGTLTSYVDSITIRAVPEPAAGVMLAAGLLALAVRRRR